MKADQSLDCLGLYCPMPIVKTAERINHLKRGEILEVVADDKGIKLDMVAWCEASGHEFLGAEEADGEIRVYVKKIHG
ncbi:MAG: sulfurtransferase TusA family protein [Dehalococcoidales bacterium]|jgi:TusA-related sulfurtransferase|nr:sulfurtransferase TusA family protein [Dehalococcoidales bacterium]